jgi:hypothetical protein
LNKEKSLLRFFGIIILFSIVAGAATIFVLNRYSFPQKPSFNNIIGLLVFFIFTTSLVYTMVSISTTKKPQKMVTYFMGATSLKLFLSLLLLAIYAMTHPATAKGFIVVFFIYYLLFTAFEVGSLIFRLNSRKSDN